MKPWMLIAICALTASAAQAQPVGENPPTTTILCLDTGGRNLPATCKVSGSRLDPREDICLCLNDGMRVVTPVCAPGVKPPAESAAFERARRAAVTRGSLVGASWNGQPMCVSPRNGPGSR